MITSIRIQNLRSIKDSGFIVLKPINILLGANSTGKSTFLRSFPLFTQSVNKKLRGPLSWFDLSLVDYGDFSTAVNKHTDPNEGIKFSFKISVSTLWRLARSYGSFADEIEVASFDGCEVEITLAGDKAGTYMKNIDIRMNSINIVLSVKKREDIVSVTVNGEDIPLPESMRFNYNTEDGVLPTIEPAKQDDKSMNYYDIILSAIINILKKHCNGRLKNISRLEGILRTKTLNQKELLYRMKHISGLQSLEDEIRNWTTKYGEFVRIYDLYVLLKIPFIINVINFEIAQYFKQCSYVAPMRAEASRYVRLQGLQVDEVDAYGRNLMEFIASLHPKKAKPDFEGFVEKLLGVTIELPTEEGQKALHVKRDDEDYSIADVGYGYSQILPIVTKIWHMQFLKKEGNVRFSGSIKSTLLIEQPELHLHPALQAKIADCFIKSSLIAKEKKYYNSFVIETHSETIISRIGRRVREGHITPDDINVLLFEKDKDTKNTNIRQCEFNEKGQLQNWPFGFFDPKDDEF